jgi:hypothetical protein
LSAGVCACGGESQQAKSQPPPQTCPPGQVFDGRYCVTQPPADPGTPTAAPDAGAPAVDAGPIPVATSLPACVALDATAASAAAQLLAPLGAQHAAPGAKPVGSLLAGQCQAGHGLEAEVMLQPGRCYTVVGTGLPPVEDLDIQLVAKLPIAGMASPILAEDKTDAANAVLGEDPSCFKWALPTAAPVRILVKVERGQGVVAAQMYEK